MQAPPAWASPPADALAAEREVEELRTRWECLRARALAYGAELRSAEQEWRVSEGGQGGELWEAHVERCRAEAEALRSLCAGAEDAFVGTWRTELADMREHVRASSERVRSVQWSRRSPEDFRELRACAARVFRALRWTADCVAAGCEAREELGAASFMALYTLVYDMMLLHADAQTERGVWMACARAQGASLCAMATRAPSGRPRAQLFRMLCFVFTWLDKSAPFWLSCAHDSAPRLAKAVMQASESAAPAEAHLLLDILRSRHTRDAARVAFGEERRLIEDGLRCARLM